eukprot:TRINITY_DN5046_c0_g1_i1.p1 TRINITY_DN5046_c0_g1~~TRINITY_DN5046_c0_g1_i1.p1  ORF type:complete len:138 (-),score=36.84 TRINITY_DN5046_c0_g1_i1:581-994(-)
MKIILVLVGITVVTLAAVPPAHGRGLLPGKLDVYARAEDAEPCTQSSKSACNKDAQCTWCTSAAVPSSCFPIRQAKHLPPAVFVCDKLGLKELLNANIKEMGEGDIGTAANSKDSKRSKRPGQKSKKKKQSNRGATL